MIFPEMFPFVVRVFHLRETERHQLFLRMEFSRELVIS